MEKLLEKITNKIDVDGELGINYQLAKKFNAVKKFIDENKNVVFENGCLNNLITDVYYLRYTGESMFTTKDYIVISLDNKYSYSFEHYKDLKIDRKYKAIQYVKENII